MYSIQPVPKRYSWGSTQRLQQLFHYDDHDPLAEMWFSGHPQSPSQITVAPSHSIAITDAIKQHPEAILGEQCLEQFGPVLPYLFKVISADIPLSLQVHPLDFQARAGFNEENAHNIALNAPERSFKDGNAKSEMVVALEPFLASVGFAPQSFALKNLAVVDHPIAIAMENALRDSSCGVEYDALMPIMASVWSQSKKRLFRAFCAAITAPTCDAQALIASLEHAITQCTHARSKLAFDFALRAARAFPGDASALVLLMMNPIALSPGESVFIPTGVPHAYIHGTGAEIMTNSDNVLRAGLTVKHKDIAHLLECVTFQSTPPINPVASGLSPLLLHDAVMYRPDVNEYVLIYGSMSQETRPILRPLARSYDSLVRRVNGKDMLPHLGPRIVLCTQGAITVISEDDRRVLTQGESVLVAAQEGWAYVEPAPHEEETGSYLAATTPF